MQIRSQNRPQGIPDQPQLIVSIQLHLLVGEWEHESERESVYALALVLVQM